MQLEELIRVAGIGQLILAAASLSIPRVLGWKEELAGLRPLTRQVFLIYASYILGTNVAFGLLSSFAPRALLDGTTLARSVAGFITLYWGARLALQLFVIDRRDVPRLAIYRAADLALTLLFAFLAMVYGLATFVGA